MLCSLCHRLKLSSSRLLGQAAVAPGALVPVSGSGPLKVNCGYTNMWGTKSSGLSQIPSEKAVRASLCCWEKEALAFPPSVSQPVSWTQKPVD